MQAEKFVVNLLTIKKRFACCCAVGEWNGCQEYALSSSGEEHGMIGPEEDQFI